MISLSYIYVDYDKFKVIVSGAKYLFVKIAVKVFFGHISTNELLLPQFFMTIIFATNYLVQQ